MVVMPSARYRPNSSGASTVVRRPRQKITTNPARTATVPISPSLLADDRQDEIGMGFRQIEQFLLAFTQAQAPWAAGADGYFRLLALIARVLRRQRRLQIHLKLMRGYRTSR